MAKAAEYSLGPETFPRGWFIVAESRELDDGPLPVRFFGKDFALYRGESGAVVMLDAYCAHMGTHIAASKSAVIVQNGAQIEGDCIRCPYHGWRYAADGRLDDIPYHQGPLPKSAALQSWHVEEVMGCVMMWHDPEGGQPDYAAPCLKEWDDPSWVHWQLDHLGEIDLHGQEILDNMADAQHLGPTHGAPCEYFENEIDGHLCIQRQGGFHQGYNAMLITTTWYTGPGVLLSKQEFGDVLTYELIANTPVDDGVSRIWHAALARAGNLPHTEEDLATAKAIQEGALQAFAADFDIWRHKRSAIRIMQMPNDGPFRKVRKWYAHFYDKRANAAEYLQQANGVYHVPALEKPGDNAREFEAGLFE